MEKSSGKSLKQVRRIALLGPESTGKTQLCMELARHFNTCWVPEYARQYLRNNNYTKDDVLHCMKLQVESEIKLMDQAKGFLFCDTELINFKVWFKDVFKTIPEGLEQLIKSHEYELTLLTYYDIPFVEDMLRVNPHRREFFFSWYEEELKRYGKQYHVIKGIGEERLEKAISAVNQLAS